MRGSRIVHDSDLKRSVCNVKTDNPGTGFFIEFLKPIRGLMTNNHVLNENFIKNEESFEIYIEGNSQKEKYKIKITSDKFIFTSKLIDVTFIQLSDDEIKRINPFFLEPDHSECYKNELIFIYQYPENPSHEQQLSKAFGEIIEIDGFNCYHSVSTDNGSSGSPLLNKESKVIGIHKGSVKSRSEIYKKLAENHEKLADKHKSFFTENNSINYATKINVVEYAVYLFCNNKNISKNINLIYDLKYEARDLAKILVESEKDILKRHDLIPKKLYYIDKEKEKRIYFSNNPLYLFEGNPDLPVSDEESDEENEEKALLFCRTNHGWYFTVNPPYKKEYSLDEIKTYNWSIIYQKKFKVSHNTISKELSNMQIVLILWLKLTEFKYLI